MKLAFSKKLIPHVVILVVVGIGLLLTWDWPKETYLFPRLTCTVVLIVGLLSLFSELNQEKKDKGEQRDVWLSSSMSEDNRVLIRRAAAIIGWLFLFIILIWLFGYKYAAVAFVFLFMKIQGQQSWRASLLFAAGAFAFLRLVFDWGLGIKWPSGILWGLLDL
jgi:hypothetical protein